MNSGHKTQSFPATPEQKRQQGCSTTAALQPCSLQSASQASTVECRERGAAPNPLKALLSCRQAGAGQHLTPRVEGTGTGVLGKKGGGRADRPSHHPRKQEEGPQKDRSTPQSQNRTHHGLTAQHTQRAQQSTSQCSSSSNTHIPLLQPSTNTQHIQASLSQHCVSCDVQHTTNIRTTLEQP